MGRRQSLFLGIQISLFIRDDKIYAILGGENISLLRLAHRVLNKMIKRRVKSFVLSNGKNGTSKKLSKNYELKRKKLNYFNSFVFKLK